jgi:hypothetical protein
MANKSAGKKGGQTFAVVLLHEANALEAASIASFVSSRPISGTVPSSSFVAGSNPKAKVYYGNRFE